MFPEDDLGGFSGETSDDSGGSLLEDIAALIGALGTAATSIIGALNSGTGAGVITVTQPPTSTGLTGNMNLLTLAAIGLGIWFIAKKA